MHKCLDLDDATVARFCERHHIRRLALFGSQLKDTARPDSDIDHMIGASEAAIQFVAGRTRADLDEDLMLMLPAGQ